MQAQSTVAPRPGITAPDGDISTLANRWPCEGAGVVRVGALCSAAGGTLTCRVIFWDALGAFAGETPPVTFTADATPLDGRLYLATADPDAWWPVGGPCAFSIQVLAVKGGAWTLSPMAQ